MKSIKRWWRWRRDQDGKLYYPRVWLGFDLIAGGYSIGLGVNASTLDWWHRLTFILVGIILVIASPWEQVQKRV